MDDVTSLDYVIHSVKWRQTAIDYVKALDEFLSLNVVVSLDEAKLLDNIVFLDDKALDGVVVVFELEGICADFDWAGWKKRGVTTFEEIHSTVQFNIKRRIFST